MKNIIIGVKRNESSLRFFKNEGQEESGIPYQTLINLYLRDCATNHRKLKMKWAS